MAPVGSAARAVRGNKERSRVGRRRDFIGGVPPFKEELCEINGAGRKSLREKRAFVVWILFGIMKE